jgi:hypothetical protein
MDMNELGKHYDRYPLGHEAYSCPSCADDVRLHSLPNLLEHTKDQEVTLENSRRAVNGEALKPGKNANESQFRNFINLFRRKPKK